jgi:hypothetical protein
MALTKKPVSLILVHSFYRPICEPALTNRADQDVRKYGLLFRCPWFRPLLGALRTARQYAPKDMFD